MSRGLAAGVATLVLAVAACSGNGEQAEAPPAPATTAAETDTAPPEPETTEPTTTTEEEEEPEDPGRPGDGGPVRLAQVASGLEAPVHATTAPGEPDRLYVVEQAGRILVLEEGRLRGEAFLDITERVQSGGERGLLSVAFHPEYEENRRFYVNFTDREGDTRVEEFEARSGREPARRRELLFVEQPYGNHNGGQLAFGPDGLLYVGMGDGGSAGDPGNRAQNLRSRLGKLMRLHVDAPGADWEIVGYGLRNPWRFSFDRVTGDLWIGDVGQGALEEVNFVAADDIGRLANFGWNIFEGTDQFREDDPNAAGRLVDPITEYPHRFGCSVTGGFVYRGRNVRRQAWGRYFYGDYCSGRVWSLALWRGEVSRRGHPFRVPGLTSFAEDANGELYLLSHEGTIQRIARP